MVGGKSIESHAKYNCYDGFYISGPKFRECLSSGWSEEEPKCIGIGINVFGEKAKSLNLYILDSCSV